MASLSTAVGLLLYLKLQMDLENILVAFPLGVGLTACVPAIVLSFVALLVAEGARNTALTYLATFGSWVPVLGFWLIDRSF